MDPARALLLACASTHPPPAERLQALLAAQPLDWGRFLALARPHGLLPLAFRHLSAVGPNTIPLAVRRQLSHHAHSTALENLRLTAQLLSLLDLLAGRGIPAVPLKGPALAASLYGDPALRPCRDLDLLLRPQDLPAAAACLARLGYARRPPPLSPAGERLFARTQCNFTFWHPGGDIVELHWDLSLPDFPAPLRPAQIWARHGWVTLAGRQVPILAAEDLLLFLCTHGAKHRWTRLAWLCDLARLLAAHPELPWPEIEARARQAGAQRLLALGLLLAARLLDAPAPAALLDRARADRTLLVLAAEVERGLLRLPRQDLDPLYAQWFHWRVRERWPEKWRVLWAAAFTPRLADFEFWHLPDAWSALYYVLRPIRLLFKYALRFVRR